MTQEISVQGQVLIFPDSMSDAEIAQAIEAEYGGGDTAQPAPRDDISAPASGAAGAAQGLTLGFGDEIYGATHSALSKVPGAQGLLNEILSLDPTYQPAQMTAGARRKAEDAGIDVPDDPYSYAGLRDAARELNVEASQANPGSYLTGEIAGGVAGGAPALGKAAVAQTFKQAIPRLAGVGALEGGIAGTGYSEGETVGEIAADAALGAGVGAGLGVALPGAVTGVQNAYRAGRNALSATGRAQRRVVADLADAGITPEQAQDILNRNPGMVLADLGRNLQQRLGGVANAPGATGQRAAQMLERRTKGQMGRFDTIFTEALDGTPVQDAAAASVARTREMAGPLYDVAYETPIPPASQARLKNLLDRDPAAVKRASKLAKRFGVDIDPEGPLNTRTVDYIQRSLRGRASALKRAGDDTEALSFSNLRDEFLREVDGPPGNPSAFKRARMIAADEFANRDALDLGSKVFREKTPNLRQAMADFSESELAHFQVGVFEEVADQMAKKGDNANLARIFDTPKRREALRLAFGNDELYEQFYRQLGNEQLMFETMNRAVNNSYTASRQAFQDAGAAGLGGGLAYAAQGDPQLAAAGAILGGAGRRGAARLAAPVARRANDAVGELLLGRNPGQLTLPPGATPGVLSSPASAIDPQKQLDLLLGRE